MAKKQTTIPAARLKAQCLALLERVGRTHEELLVTKRGRPVAQVVAAEPLHTRPLSGSIVADDDLVSPLVVRWDATQ
ncbi:MAG TPA: type II toxin-antitoxin system prevent-host-death family antitoxin [Myxococcaceae bacterium]|jgi:prevent-host-death family protein